MDLVSLGNILKETIVDKDGRRQFVLGGPAAYSTVCVACLGGEAGIVTRVGDDMPADFLQVFADAGVDQGGLDRKSPATTTNVLGYDDQGRKRILRYDAVAPPINLGQIPASFFSSKVFYVCGSNFDVGFEVVEKLASCGGLMACDLTGLGGTGQPVNGGSLFLTEGETFRRYVSHFEIIKASEDDCILLAGESVDAIPDLARDILSWGPKVVLLTRGGNGTDIYTPNGVETVPAFRGEARVVDTTGAGDCYTAGFFFRYARTHDLADAVRFGSMAAYHVIQQTGGVVTCRMPTSAQVEEALRGWRK